MGIKLSAKENVLKLKYVGTFQEMSEKVLTRHRIKALKEVTFAHEFVRKHKGELKKGHAKSRKATIILEAINQVQLG